MKISNFFCYIFLSYLELSSHYRIMKPRLIKGLILFLAIITFISIVSYSSIGYEAISNSHVKAGLIIDDQLIVKLIDSFSKTNNQTIDLIRSLKKDSKEKSDSLTKYSKLIHCQSSYMKTWTPGSITDRSVYSQLAPDSSQNFEHLRGSFSSYIYIPEFLL